MSSIKTIFPHCRVFVKWRFSKQNHQKKKKNSIKFLHLKIGSSCYKIEKNVDDIWHFAPGKDKLVSVQVMNTCGDVQVWLPLFLTSKADDHDWLASGTARFTVRTRTYSTQQIQGASRVTEVTE